MPIWFHRVLGALVQVAGFFGGALAGWGVTMLVLMALSSGREAGQQAGRGGRGVADLCIFAVGAALSFTGAWLGLRLCYGLFVRNVPACCPQCAGRSYHQSENADHVRYRCRACGHVYLGRSWAE